MADILQWNIRGLSANWEELNLLIEELNPRIICLQETMLGQRTPLCPNGFLSLHFEMPLNGGHHGGSALFYRHDVPFSPINLQTPLQAVAGRVYLEKEFTVCSLYLPPNDNISRQALEHLLAQLPRPVILLGDMNARHSLWGDSTHNARGTMFAKLLEESDMVFLNSGEPTHFHTQSASLSVIDLSICSPEIALEFNWMVSCTLRGSDHYPIMLQMATSPPATSQPKWCLNRADWDTFQSLCTFEESVHDFDTVDDTTDYVVSRITMAASLSIPRTSGHFNRRPVPWWNRDCAVARQAARRAESRFKRNPASLELKIAFHRSRAQYRRILKDARRGSWRTYVNSINASTPITQIWQRVRKMKGKYTPASSPVLSIDGNSVAEPARVAEHFANQFASISRPDVATPEGRKRLREEQKNIDFSSPGGESYNVPFELRELLSALKTCDDSTPGPDDVPYALVRHLNVECFNFLLSFFNRIWTEGAFPSQWGLATVLPIPKPGKDHSNISNFRPISLTSCICKLFEKMVNLRLVWVLESGKHISPSQCGFRKHHSTTNALVSLESSICKAFASKQHHISVFFDLQKAYDTTWRYGILKSLYQLGLRGCMPVFIRNFLNNRRIRVRVRATMSDDRNLTGQRTECHPVCNQHQWYY